RLRAGDELAVLPLRTQHPGARDLPRLGEHVGGAVHDPPRFETHPDRDPPHLLGSGRHQRPCALPRPAGGCPRTSSTCMTPEHPRWCRVTPETLRHSACEAGHGCPQGLGRRCRPSSLGSTAMCSVMLSCSSSVADCSPGDALTSRCCRSKGLKASKRK